MWLVISQKVDVVWQLIDNIDLKLWKVIELSLIDMEYFMRGAFTFGEINLSMNLKRQDLLKYMYKPIFISNSLNNYQNILHY